MSSSDTAGTHIVDLRNVADPGPAIVLSMPTLAALIRARRRELGWSQQQLANAAGVVTRTMGSWERGLAEPRGAHVRQLGAALGGALVFDDESGEWSLTRTGQTVTESEPDDDAVVSVPSSVLDGLSPAQRVEVFTVARLAAIERARLLRGE